jgi:hypothetical protein
MRSSKFPQIAWALLIFATYRLAQKWIANRKERHFKNDSFAWALGTNWKRDWGSDFWRNIAVLSCKSLGERT